MGKYLTYEQIKVGGKYIGEKNKDYGEFYFVVKEKGNDGESFYATSLNLKDKKVEGISHNVPYEMGEQPYRKATEKEIEKYGSAIIADKLTK